MPFKSKAQRRKFAELLVKGKISPETFEEWNRETGAAKLPERVARKRPRKRIGAAKKRAGAAKKKTDAASRKRGSERPSVRKSARKRRS